MNNSVKLENHLSDNLDFLMGKSKLSANDLSSHIAIPPVTIRKLRTGEITNPTFETISPIAKFFDVSLDEIFFNNLAKKGPSKKNFSQIPLIQWSEIDKFPHVE